MHFRPKTGLFCIDKRSEINRFFCLISTKLYLPLLANYARTNTLARMLITNEHANNNDTTN